MGLYDYQDLRFTIVHKNEKRPLEADWPNTKNYPYNSAEIQSALKEGYNLGIVCGYGCLVVVDVDKKGKDFAEVNEIVKEFLPKTLTIKTQSGGKHYYFFCPEIQNEIILKEGTGEIRSRGNQVLCPPSQINGNKYEFENDEPIKPIGKVQLLTALQKWLVEKERPEIPVLKEEENLKIADFIDLKQLKQRGNEYYGAHPLHGSEGGMNFWVNAEKNCWHCFRDSSGGGVLSWIAVKEGLITCEQAQKDALRGAIFLQLIKICAEKYKIEIKTKRDVSTIDRGEFNIEPLKKLFEGTHLHLPYYNLLIDELSLVGENYYPIKKFAHYFLVASAQPATTCSVGYDYYDNRINGLIIGGAGKGKGVLKNTIRRLRNFDRSVLECSGVTHPEQLIGKYIKVGKEIKENKGYLGAKILFHDEAQDVLNEKDNFCAQCMNIMRKAQDIYGSNLLDKKLVADFTPLEYCPETIFMTFMHPIPLQARFFDTGSFRRYFCFNIGVAEQRELDECIMNLFKERSNENALYSIIKEKVENAKRPFISFSEKAKQECARWILEWNKFLVFSTNQQVRMIGEKLFQSLKNYFMRPVIIAGIDSGREAIDENTAFFACFDASQFLLETIEYFVQYSNISLSSDIWRTTDLQEAMLLEWLWHNGAKDKESKMSISDCQDAIQDFFGLNDRQARSRFNKLKKEGLICSKKGKWDSQVWLAFSPRIETIRRPEGCVNTDEEFYNFLNAQRNRYFRLIDEIQRNGKSGESGNLYPIKNIEKGYKSGESGNVGDTPSNLQMRGLYIYNNSYIDNIVNSKGISDIAPLTTLEKPPTAEPTPLSPTMQLETLRQICSELAGAFSAPLAPKDIFERAGRQGLSIEQASGALEYMRQNGELYQPEPGKWKLARKEGGA